MAQTDKNDPLRPDDISYLYTAPQFEENQDPSKAVIVEYYFGEFNGSDASYRQLEFINELIVDDQKSNPNFNPEVLSIVPKGMKPFYYFCDDVEERYTERSVDNQTNGVQNLPNKWIHHNTQANFGKDYSELTEEEQIKANAWLDYSEWTPPPYKEHYYDADLDLPEKFVVVQNSYNYSIFDFFSHL